MTQIKNPKNGNQKGTVTIVGYSERFFFNATPPVHIMKDLLEIGEVEKNGKIEIAIEEESRIVFKCNQCSRRFSPIVVKPGDWVVLIYDQAMDCIVPVVTDSEHYGQAKMIYRETQKQMISPEHPRLRSDKIAAYTIGEDVSNGGTSNHQWIWGVIGVILLVLILYFNGVFSSNSSSYSNTSSSYTITSFTSAKDVLNFIDGKSIYTSLGNLYVKNGAVYDGSGAYVNDIIVDSYTTNSATISIYPTQYSGYAMKFKVDKATGTISREN